MGIIYKVTSLSGKVYIGCTKGTLQKRRGGHERSALSPSKNYNTKFSRAIRKYGVNAFIWEVLEEAPDDLLEKIEVSYIKYFNSVKNGFNTLCDETLGNFTRGKKLSEERKKFLRRINTGRKPSEETIKRRSEIAKRQYRDGTRILYPGQIERLIKLGKRKRSPEEIEKMRQKLKGRIPWNKGKKGLKATGGSFKKGIIPWNKGKTKDEHPQLSNSGRKRKILN